MQIGIITFHRAHNYGAVLQCYALQQVLINMGHKVEVIDYVNPYIDWLYKPHKAIVYVIKQLFQCNIYKIRLHIESYRLAKKRSIFFGNFVKKYLRCTSKCDEKTIPQNFDAYIIGSDQMWSLDCSGGADSVYWGTFEKPCKSKLYGFSISANGDFKKSLSDCDVLSCLSNFDDVSFREADIAKLFEEISGVKYPITLDPTLLTDAKLWNPLSNSKWKDKKYVVIYQIRRLESNPQMLEKCAIAYANKYNFEVIDLSGMDYTVEDFVSAIRFAQAVFTSSFHATAFSVIFQKRFLAFKLYDGRDARYENLLMALNLENHLVDEQSLDTTPPEFVLTKEEKNKYENLKKQSLDYLKQIVD